jgi:hypothetical protein
VSSFPTTFLRDTAELLYFIKIAKYGISDVLKVKEPTRAKLELEL